MIETCNITVHGTQTDSLQLVFPPPCAWVGAAEIHDGIMSNQDCHICHVAALSKFWRLQFC